MNCAKSLRRLVSILLVTGMTCRLNPAAAISFPTESILKAADVSPTASEALSAVTLFSHGPKGLNAVPERHALVIQFRKIDSRWRRMASVLMILIPLKMMPAQQTDFIAPIKPSVAAVPSNPHFSLLERATHAHVAALQVKDLEERLFLFPTMENRTALVDALAQADALLKQTFQEADVSLMNDTLGISAELLLDAQNILTRAASHLSGNEVPLPSSLFSGLGDRARELARPNYDATKQAMMPLREILLSATEPFYWVHVGTRVILRTHLVPRAKYSRNAAIAYVLLGGSLSNLDRRYQHLKVERYSRNEAVSRFAQEDHQLAERAKRLEQLGLFENPSFKAVEELRRRALTELESGSVPLNISDNTTFLAVLDAEQRLLNSLSPEEREAVLEWRLAYAKKNVAQAWVIFYERSDKNAEEAMHGELGLAHEIIPDRDLDRFSSDRVVTHTLQERFLRAVLHRKTYGHFLNAQGVLGGHFVAPDLDVPKFSTRGAA